MITPNSIQQDANSAIDIYAQMEQDIYALIFKTIKTTKYDSVDADNVLAWQLEQLSKMGVLNKQVVQLVSKYTHKSEEAIEHLVKDNGIQIVDEVDQELSGLLHKKVAVGDDTRDIINSQLNQTMHDLDNTVSQTLLTTSMGQNSAVQVFQKIVKQTTLETSTGLKTHQQALNETCEKWVSNGIPVLVDKAGRRRSIEGYARTVIQSTSHRTFNNLRLKRMEDYGTHLALMSSHPASREACAPIQGKVLNIVPSDDPNFNSKYDTIYNHGYGTPSGTQGINCTHILYPFIEGVNTNNQPQYDPEEAQKNGELQAKQRGYERAIRDTKKKLEAAKELGDEVGIQKYKAQLAAQQKRLREFIKPHSDFLHRDYSREKVYSSKTTQPKPVKQEPNKTEFKSSVKDSDIINAFEKTNVKEAFGDEYYKQFKSSISSLKDEQLRKLYANYGRDLEFANVSKTGGSYARTSTVHLNNSAFEGSDISEPMETVYHEIGHAIDSTSMNDVFGKQLIPTGRQIKQRLAGKTYKFDEQASHLSADPAIDLGRTIKQDLFDYINHGEAKSPMQMGKKPRKKAEKAIWMEEASKSWEGVEKIRQFIRDTKPTALENLRKYSNVSDMIEGTGYDVFDHPWNAGHGSKYWKDYGKEETEFFAEYTSARATNPASLALIKEIFPNAAKICDSLIDKMVEVKK